MARGAGLLTGNRAIYYDGWRAVCPWPGPSFSEASVPFGTPIDFDTLTKLDATGWELYNVAEDFCETKNVAGEERDRLIAMIGMWYAEAGKCNVLPIDSRTTQRFAEERPKIAPDRKKCAFYPGTQVVPSNAVPSVVNVTHSVSVHVNVPKGGAEGVLFCMGGNDGGFVFYVKDGKLTYGYNYVADHASACSRQMAQSRQVSASSPSSSRPQASRTSPRAKACRQTSNCSSTARRLAKAIYR